MDRDTDFGRRKVLAGLTAVTTGGLAGCIGGGSSGNSSSNNSGNSSASGSGGGEYPQADLTAAAGPDGGTSFPMITVMGQLIRNETGNQIVINSQTTGGSAANIELIGTEHDVGYTTSPTILRESGYEGRLLPMFTSYVYRHPLAITTAAAEENRGQSMNLLEDLEGARFVTGAPGSGAWPYMESYFRANNLDLDSMRLNRVSEEEGGRLLEEGRVDATIWPGAVTAWLSELMQRRDDLKLVLPKPESLPAARRASNTVEWTLTPEGKGQLWENSVAGAQGESEWPGSGSAQIQCANPDVPNEVTYAITRLTYENANQLSEENDDWSLFANSREETATLFQDETAPYHPGAAEAMRDLGIWPEDFPIYQSGSSPTAGNQSSTVTTNR